MLSLQKQHPGGKQENYKLENKIKPFLKKVKDGLVTLESKRNNNKQIQPLSEKFATIIGKNFPMNNLLNIFL